MFFISIYYWERLRYNASFALVFACNIATASALVLAVALVLKLIKFLINRFLIPKKIITDKKDTQPTQPLLNPVDDEEHPSAPKRASKWACRKFGLGVSNVINIIATALLIFPILALSIIPSAFYGLHLLSFIPTMIAMFTFYLFWLTLLLFRLGSKKKRKD